MRHIQLRKEIETVLNRNCAENGPDTPDYILAEYLTDCLDAFDKAAKARENWYGRGTAIGADQPNPTENAPCNS